MQCEYERENCLKIATKWFMNIISHKLYHMFSFPLFSKYSFIYLFFEMANIIKRHPRKTQGVNESKIQMVPHIDGTP
jgi:hypothetical protein